jgi:hypothetical protein
MEKFYLGTHQPHWLASAGVPLFVSHRRLVGRKTLPRAIDGWALDSGGFSELSLFNEWRTTPEAYVDAVRRYSDDIDRLEWAAPQDWMCEPVMLAKTGLDVPEHQRRTVANFLRLRDLWDERTDGAESPFMPVLQGWQRDDYLRCADLYAAAGVVLSDYEIVGLGSVCRRQATAEIGEVVTAVRAHVGHDLPLHGFGVKARGLELYGHHLRTADSMAWSYSARREAPLPGCTGHKNCANCAVYALRWRAALLARLDGRPIQASLFEGGAA